MGYMNYEERLEVAKKLYKLSNEEQKTALECIFPELCESEDEKTRKEIIEYVTLYKDSLCDEEYKTWIAWLEKQGNQNHIEQNNEMVEALRTEYEKGRADAFAQMQKEWSEEDENKIDTIISVYRPSPKLVNWLQSLKERHIWKPSDEQMVALEYIINNARNISYSCKIAKELLEQLKKQKGE